jgi:hypothetical protein
LWQEFFDPLAVVEVKPGEISDVQHFGMVVIEFDKEGFVTSPHTHPGPLRGRLNRLQYLSLAAGDDPPARVYDLAKWFTGIGDASTHWAPGFCQSDQTPNPVSVRLGYIYSPKFKADKYDTTFACREWAYQLYDPERPYIDVTNYVWEGKGAPKHTRIRPFIGWARFGDQKPVIGNHKGVWYCLHDCPNGDRPGRIEDIQAWAKQNGWTAPKPPTKAPTFPDPPAKSGTYPR